MQIDKRDDNEQQEDTTMNDAEIIQMNQELTAVNRDFQ